MVTVDRVEPAGRLNGCRTDSLEETDIQPFVELSLRACSPVFDSIEEALGAPVFLRLHPDWRVDQRQAVEAACTAETISVWVAESAGKVVGFVAVNLPLDSVLGEIHMLAVDPDHQYSGLGTAMTSFAIEQMKKAGKTVAMVETGSDPGHAAAHRTYEKVDFKLVPVARYFQAL